MLNKFKDSKTSPLNKWVLAWRKDLKKWFVGRRCDERKEKFPNAEIWETSNHNFVIGEIVTHWISLPLDPNIDDYQVEKVYEGVCQY